MIQSHEEDKAVTPEWQNSRHHPEAAFWLKSWIDGPFRYKTGWMNHLMKPKQKNINYWLIVFFNMPIVWLLQDFQIFSHHYTPTSVLVSQNDVLFEDMLILQHSWWDTRLPKMSTLVPSVQKWQIWVVPLWVGMVPACIPFSSISLSHWWIISPWFLMSSLSYFSRSTTPEKDLHDWIIILNLVSL